MMDMQATKQLKEEHKAVKQALKILDKICKKLSKGEKVDPKHLDNLLDFLRTFVDKCHHGKEEGVLFPAMEKAGVPNEDGPIGMMLIEHDMGRGFIRGMAEGIEKYGKGEVKAAKEIVKNTRDYTVLLNDHIDKEDNILYMIADMHLPPDDQKDLLKEFDKIEEEKVGEGKHEQFHKMLNELKISYS